MDFNLLFSLSAALSFTILYCPDSDEKQDFFIFNGGDSIVHLFRNNDTLKFYLQSGNTHQLYQTENITDCFRFTWEGFEVNRQRLELVKSNGQLGQLQFDSYTFLSPHLDLIRTPVIEQTEPIYNLFSNVNYWYLMLIVLFVGLILKTDKLMPKLLEGILQNLRQSTAQQEDESIYVEMQL